MEIRIQTQRWAEILAAWNTAPKIVRGEIAAAVFEAESYLQKEIQDRTEVGATGFLRLSIFSENPKIEGDTILGVVGSALRYAEPVELGTKPHWAPIQPLIDWVEKKLGIGEKESYGVARKIQFKIAHKGTQGQFMFKRAFEFGKPTVDAIFEARAQRILARLAGAQ